ncbi:MAG: hypothetical protein AABW99_01925 [archaeon]
MGLLGNFFGKKEEKEEKKVEGSSSDGKGKYQQACSLCGNPGTDKKWAGQYWHVKCLRRSRKFARGML